MILAQATCGNMDTACAANMQLGLGESVQSICRLGMQQAVHRCKRGKAHCCMTCSAALLSWMMWVRLPIWLAWSPPDLQSSSIGYTAPWKISRVLLLKMLCMWTTTSVRSPQPNG